MMRDCIITTNFSTYIQTDTSITWVHYMSHNFNDNCETNIIERAHQNSFQHQVFQTYRHVRSTTYHINKIHIDRLIEPDETLATVLRDDTDDDDIDEYLRDIHFHDLFAIYG